MKFLNIMGSASSPSIVADWEQGSLTMRGDSYPENSFELFQPVIEWLEAYLAADQRPLRLEFELLYLNTSSIRAVMDMLDMLEEVFRDGREVSLRWLYDDGNERMAELAEEFKEDCSFPFVIARKSASHA